MSPLVLVFCFCGGGGCGGDVVIVVDVVVGRDGGVVVVVVVVVAAAADDDDDIAPHVQQRYVLSTSSTQFHPDGASRAYVPEVDDKLDIPNRQNT